MSESAVGKIVKIEHHPVEELIERLRRVTMLKAPEVKVYEKACISLERIRTSCIRPTQRYALTRELDKVRDLRWALRDQGYDLFGLEGYLTLHFEGLEEPIDVIPPLVEETIEPDGTLMPIINDGMHRMHLAHVEWVIPQVIYIRGIPKEYPYYAYPLREGWDGVEIVSRLDADFIKKWHRIKDNKTLYRNFNSAFNNIGGPRGKG